MYGLRKVSSTKREIQSLRVTLGIHTSRFLAAFEMTFLEKRATSPLSSLAFAGMTTKEPECFFSLLFAGQYDLRKIPCQRMRRLFRHESIAHQPVCTKTGGLRGIQLFANVG